MAATGLSSGGARKKRGNKFACGVPTLECIGSPSQVSNGLSKSPKTHGSPEQAFSCYVSYLLRSGYKQVGPREFCKDGGPVVVLTKKSRFGARLRGGKGERFMPDQMLGGHIV